MNALKLDEYLIDALVRSTMDGLSMVSITPEPIGSGRYITSSYEVSAIIGFVGAVSGSVSINMSAAAAKYLTARLNMGEAQHAELTGDDLETICEIVNIIAGKLKAILSASENKIEKISVPSVVVGSNFSLTYSKGMQTLNVEFEIPGVMSARRGSEYIFSVYLSMLRS